MLRDEAEDKKILTCYLGLLRTQNCYLQECKYENENDIDYLPTLVNIKYGSYTVEILVNLKQVLNAFTLITVWLNVKL